MWKSLIMQDQALFTWLLSAISETVLPCQKLVTWLLSSNVYSAPFDLVHTDLWGPIVFMSKTGFQYYISFVNACTKYIRYISLNSNQMLRLLSSYFMSRSGLSSKLMSKFCTLVERVQTFYQTSH